MALVGLPASGKSSVGRILAGLLGLEFRDSDGLVEAGAGMGVAAIFEAEGEAAFRRREARALAEAAEGPPLVLATGGGIVLSTANRELLGRRFETVWLRLDPAVAAARAALAPGSRPLLAQGDPAARMRALAEAREPLYAEVADLVVEAGEGSPEEIARDIAGGIARAIAEP